MAKTALNRWLLQAYLMSLVLFAPGSTVAVQTFLPRSILTQSEEVPVTASWSLENAPDGVWTIGDRIQLFLTVTYPANGHVTISALPEMWGSFEVREQTPSKPVDHSDGMVSVVSEATVMLWSPGEHQTPQFSVDFRDDAGQLHKVPVPPISLSVASVLKDGETEKRDLKPQASLPEPPVWPWALGAFLVVTSGAMAAWALYAWLRRRTAVAYWSGRAPDPDPAHEVAYRELGRIAALNLPIQGEIQYHYTLIADCVRVYLHARYGIAAMDQTTEELAAALHQLHMGRSHVGLFQRLLAEADLVKFAEFRPSLGQAGAAIAQARLVVDVTRIDKPTGGQTAGSGDASRIPSPQPPRSGINPSDHEI